MNHIANLDSSVSGNGRGTHGVVRGGGSTTRGAGRVSVASAMRGRVSGLNRGGSFNWGCGVTRGRGRVGGESVRADRERGRGASGPGKEVCVGRVTKRRWKECVSRVFLWK